MNKYKHSPIFYMGNKYKLLKYIIPLFPKSCDVFVDGFGGSAVVSINYKGKNKTIYNEYNPNSSEWDNYGGRGISSEEYKFFIDFFDDMYQSYVEHKIKYGEKDTTLDRINPNGDYTKSNIRWATRIEQQNNTRDQLRTFIGISPVNEEYIFHNIKQFSLEHNLSKENVSATIRGVNKTCSGWKFYEKV